MPHYTGGLSDGRVATSLSDGRDPLTPARVIPGGFVPEESVEATYADANARAVTLADAGDWLRVDGDAWGLTQLIEEVQAHVEYAYGLALVPQTVTCLASGPCYEVRLPRLPANTLTSVKEVQDGVEGSDEADDYYLQAGRLHVDGAGYAVGARHPRRLVYEAGYAEGGLPRDLRLAMKRTLRTHYDDRGNLIVGRQVQEVPQSAAVLFEKYGRP